MTSDTSDSPRPAKKRKSTDRTSQACIKCRAQKMKCIGASDPPCRRCRITKSLCEFVPRVNAAVPLSPIPYPSHTCTEIWRNEVNKRVKDLEETNLKLQSMVNRLLRKEDDGVTSAHTVVGDNAEPSAHPSSLVEEPDVLYLSQAGGSASSPLHQDVTQDDIADFNFSGVWSAIDALKEELPASLSQHEAWDPDTITKLWISFRSHMPGLHFFSGQVSFTHPTPLLAVSILYVAAAHYPSADLASFQPIYLRAFCRAVGSLTIPDLGKPSGDISTPFCSHDSGASSDKFDDVLGIILVGLLAIGWVDTVGMWVNVAYRLLLDGMAMERGKRQEEWKGLWEGLRTIELEHSSLHLVCPALPVVPPDPPFPSTQESATSSSNAAGAIGELLQVMQVRMPRFVGRGLPTVWETVCCPPDRRKTQVQTKVDDLQAIQSWAGEIDQWYARHAPQNVNANMYVRSVILLNYHLHKLFVLSIFLPLRGVNSVSFNERKALLESSRLVLQIQGAGFEVWSGWDLVILTQASLILLSSVATGTSDHRDLRLVQHHLDALTATHQAPPSLRHTLAERLKQALQRMHVAADDDVNTRRANHIVRSSSTTVTPLSTLLPTNRPRSHEQGISANTIASETVLDTRPLFMSQAPAFTQMDFNFDTQASQTTWNLRESEPAAGTSSVTEENLEWPPFLLSMFGYDQSSQETYDWSFGEGPNQIV
ncbi:hypothetical protein CI109_100715 [Kwoniella shandongensis]|uniref:Uncharacterized protein n=1 Tax=Kwoniella shandongensis TaxID=1734106 RepID=A0A5M6BZ14_9TREE|nr:uncharacterized protein CI109_003364 [Kwoniella shandongensis]KAA5528076.1 hypothetical protein CI109_003364 [Kwoniella shandongensis]